MRAGGAAGGAHQADKLTPANHLPDADQHLGHVPINRLEAVSMIDLHINPVVPPASPGHLAAVSRQFRGANVIRNVDPGMVLPEILRERSLGWPAEAHDSLAPAGRVGGGGGNGRDRVRLHRRDEELAWELAIGTEA